MGKGLLALCVLLSGMFSEGRGETGSPYSVLTGINAQRAAGFIVNSDVSKEEISIPPRLSFEAAVELFSRERGITILPLSRQKVTDEPEFGLLEGDPIAAEAGILLVFRRADVYQSQVKLHFEVITLKEKMLYAYGPKLGLVEEFEGAEQTPTLDEKNWKLNDRRLRRLPVTLDIFRVTPYGRNLRKLKVKLYHETLFEKAHTEVDLNFPSLVLTKH